MMDPGVDPAKAIEMQRDLDALNAKEPPDLFPSPLMGLQRHGCTEARQAKAIGRPVQVAIRLKEKYDADEESGHAIVYREGRCPSCKTTARSRVGRVVLIANRPPIEGRVSRG